MISSSPSESLEHESGPKSFTTLLFTFCESQETLTKASKLDIRNRLKALLQLFFLILLPFSPRFKAA